MLLVALVLGLVEGLTEFLPISSTGHLILASAVLRFEGDRAELFQIFIQLGAILSVVWEFRGQLRRIVVELPRSGASRRFVFRIGLAFLPAAILGLLLHDVLIVYLLTPRSVALALIVGAVLILVVESLSLVPRTDHTEKIGQRQAIGIGLAQCAALWPGFSRSAATILGGVVVGLDRRTATKFSFFLAIPTMFGASAYSLMKYFEALQPGDVAWLAIAFAISFVVAWASVRWLLRFVSTHTFRVFAWYRIVLGVVILLVLDRMP